MADHNTTYKRKVPLNLPEPPRKKGKLAFEECALCCTEVLISHFAERPHASATNECRTCFKCWGKHFRHQLTVKDWDELSCLQCGTILTLEEYDEISSGIKDKDEISTTFQRKATESYLRQDLGDGECFVTCPSSTCKGGAIMADGHIFTCPDCKARYCFDCEAPMHENMSCEEFLEMPKKRNKEKAEEEILAAATLKKHSKECPKCKARLQKISGCDHFTCTMCNHEFCWLCFAPYRGADGIAGPKGNAAHNGSCQYYSGGPVESPRIPVQRARPSAARVLLPRKQVLARSSARSRPTVRSRPATRARPTVRIRRN
ncbi:uncharacterized protein RHO25_007809 [Cercospora beticola]|uniref:RBR-type E3 ubiquitin transferase n=1 Tax=Cercospora beticola TaxID=122368 RepID=A0ABZ0NUA5_CERBT|nr:hypothetical protein RHO25_007809 [Cercospora beticola]